MLAARDLAPIRQMTAVEPTLSVPWPDARPLPDTFFDRDAQLLARGGAYARMWQLQQSGED